MRRTLGWAKWEAATALSPLGEPMARQQTAEVHPQCQVWLSIQSAHSDIIFTRSAQYSDRL
jgi:hypothetical protein